MTDPKKNELSDRRAKLDAALARKQSEKIEVKRSTSDKSSWGPAVKISSEFIGGVLVGAGIGYLADKFLGTAPWGMIVFLLLGFCAGILNVLRSTGKVAQPDNRMADQSSETNTNIAGNSKKT